MNRTQARQAIATALSSVGFDLIVQGTPDSFNGKLEVAVITSAGTERVQDARDLASDVHSLAVSIYVYRPAGASAATEARLDALVLATIDAIDVLDSSIVFQRSDAGASGAPNRLIDGKLFRVERVFFTIWGLP